MFSFGLFSTHIPYIALVVFYAYFFLFGINKAAAGELSDSSIKTEILVTKHFNGKIITVTDLCDSANSFAIFRNHIFKEAVFRKKIRHPLLNFSTNDEFFCSSAFCRPPPVA